jgi:hypothetical protein
MVYQDGDVFLEDVVVGRRLGIEGGGFGCIL